MSQVDESGTAACEPDSGRVTIPWPGRRLDTPLAQLEGAAHEHLLPVLSGPEALVVAELLEQIADDPADELSAIAQLLIMRIHDRLEIIEGPTAARTPQPPGKVITLFTPDPRPET